MKFAEQDALDIDPALAPYVSGSNDSEVSVEVTHGKTFAGTPTENEKITEARGEFVCVINGFHLQGAKSEYAWSVHRNGTEKTHGNYDCGYATTLRGAKSSVSKAIAKMGG